MPTLLQIDSSSMGSDASVSRQLTAEFVRQWLQANPDGQVVTRDLLTTNLPLVTADWIAAAHTPESSRTPQQKHVLAVSDALIQELQSADEYVIGVALYNFSFPAAVKLWIDQVARAGKTFSYQDGKPVGLLTNKKATFIVASGGVYDAGTPMAAMNFAEPYLRSMFGFLGVTDTRFINAGGTARLRFGAERAAVLQPALASIRAQLSQPQPIVS